MSRSPDGQKFEDSEAQKSEVQKFDVKSPKVWNPEIQMARSLDCQKSEVQRSEDWKNGVANVTPASSLTTSLRTLDIYAQCIYS